MNRVKLCLLPVGGGAFDNPRENIANAVLQAFNYVDRRITVADRELWRKMHIALVTWKGSDKKQPPGETAYFKKYFAKSDREVPVHTAL